MALIIDNCLIPQGGGTNETYGSCCCSASCTLTNQTGSAIALDAIFASFQNAQFGLNSEVYSFQGIPITAFPFFIPPNESIQILASYCASDVGTTDTLFFYTEQNGGDVEIYFFDFVSIDLNTSIDVSSIDFSNVPIGSSASFPVIVYNPTSCCYNYDIYTDCDEVITDNTSTNKLCNTDSQTINVVYTPTVAGSIACTLTLANECQSLNIPITGNAIAPETSVSSNGQKNKVDQTSVLPACSPRTINNRCNTAQTASAAITSRAQTITRPAGGAGRGKGFSK